MITIPHATEAIRMQAFQTHTAAQPISIQLLQTQQKPHVTKARHNAEKHSLFKLINFIKLNKTNLIKYTTNREARGARDPHPHLGSKFFLFFLLFLARNLQNNRLAHPLWELAPPGKSWIRHWLLLVLHN